MNVCIQINIDEEDNKNGIMIKEFDRFYNEISRFKYLKLRGIMSASSQYDKNCSSFREMGQLYNQYNELDVLSMGMSGDYLAAIENNANMIRIGQYIFGKDMKKKISIIGAGNLTLSLLSSIEACSKDYIISIVDNRSRKRLLKSAKVSFVPNIDNNISDSKVIFLNVKPKRPEICLKSLKPYVGAKNIIISFMAAGIKVNDIKKALDTETSVIRCMTNISAINNDAIIFYFMKNLISNTLIYCLQYLKKTKNS